MISNTELLQNKTGGVCVACCVAIGSSSLRPILQAVTLLIHMEHVSKIAGGLAVQNFVC